MAEAIARRELPQMHPHLSWKVASAGVWAQPGYPATKAAQMTAEEHGLDLSKHTSQPVTETLLAQSDIVLVMEQRHKEALRRLYPAYADRVHLLSELAGEAGDIADPIGLPLPAYRATFEQLQTLIRRVGPKLAGMAEAFD